MSTAPSLPLRPAGALPPAPRLADLVEAAEHRIAALTTQALPNVRAQRDLLLALWHTPGADAVLLPLEAGLSFPCAPAGAERLASALAYEEALLREHTALHDLVDALHTYAAGGREMQIGVGGAIAVETQDGERLIAPPPAPLSAPCTRRGRTQTRRLKKYLATIERDMHRAAAAGRASTVAKLSAERDAVAARLARRIAPGAATARRRARCEPEPERAGHLSLLKFVPRPRSRARAVSGTRAAG